MPYTTERGVTSYSDRDTPLEYASGQDEDAARFNDARDRAFAATEDLSGLLDNLYGDPIPSKAGEMVEIADAIDALLARARLLSA
jgi:hypothetical protein